MLTLNAATTRTIREDAEAACRFLMPWLGDLNGSTMLVTGAGGFLCSHFLETIAVFNESARPGCRVLAVDNFRSGVPERLSWIEGRKDIELRQCDASQAFEPGERVDWIIHGASIASPPLYRQYPLETIDVNVNGTPADARPAAPRWSGHAGSEQQRNLRRSGSGPYPNFRKTIVAMCPAPDRARVTTNLSDWRKRLRPLTIGSIVRR